MARVISVTLPLWQIDRLTRSASEGAPVSGELPLVRAGRVSNRRLMTAACGMARDLGLSSGMPVSKAQTLVLILLGAGRPPNDENGQIWSSSRQGGTGNRY